MFRRSAPQEQPPGRRGRCSPCVAIAGRLFFVRVVLHACFSWSFSCICTNMYFEYAFFVTSPLAWCFLYHIYRVRAICPFGFFPFLSFETLFGEPNLPLAGLVSTKRGARGTATALLSSAALSVALRSATSLLCSAASFFFPSYLVNHSTSVFVCACGCVLCLCFSTPTFLLVDDHFEA